MGLPPSLGVSEVGPHSGGVHVSSEVVVHETIRGLLRPAAAEFVGSALFVFIACGSAMTTVNHQAMVRTQTHTDTNNGHTIEEQEEQGKQKGHDTPWINPYSSYPDGSSDCAGAVCSCLSDCDVLCGACVCMYVMM